MPFVGPHPADPSRWRPVSTVDLRQLPVERRWKVEFAVIREFGYTELPADRGTADEPEWTTPAVQHVVPRGLRTDLASVPWFLWGVIASYGRQTLPAILHDLLCFAAEQPGQPVGCRNRLRREADDLFRTTLRVSGAGLIRRSLMWSAVRLFGHPAVATAFVLILVATIVAAVASARQPGLVWAPAVAAAATFAMVVSVSVERRREPRADAGEFTPAHVEPGAVLSLLGAMLVAMLAAPPILVISAATAVTEFVVGLGERTVRGGAGGGAGGGAAPVLEEEQVEGPTARITWAPLVGSDGAEGPGS